VQRHKAFMTRIKQLLHFQLGLALASPRCDHQPGWLQTHVCVAVLCLSPKELHKRRQRFLHPPPDTIAIFLMVRAFASRCESSSSVINRPEANKNNVLARDAQTQRKRSSAISELGYPCSSVSTPGPSTSPHDVGRGLRLNPREGTILVEPVFAQFVFKLQWDKLLLRMRCLSVRMLDALPHGHGLLRARVLGCLAELEPRSPYCENSSKLSHSSNRIILIHF